MAISRRAFLRRALGTAGALALTGSVAHGGERPRAGEPWRPAYLRLEEEGRFAERVEAAYDILEACTLCPRGCGVDRRAGETGVCRTGESVVVASVHPHYGEELPLVGQFGSGTIFFSNCNLRCVFCQNWPIAHEGRGDPLTIERLAEFMLRLQAFGCHNVNLVTPTHVMPQILAATRLAAQNGLRIPLVYNTGGYDALEAVRLLDGVVDIYLPDLKFMDGEQAERYALAADYPETAQRAIEEMHRQVGVLQTDGHGIALRGVMLRHLVMPNRVAGTRELVRWVADRLAPDTYVNIMAQYRVEHRAFEHPDIARAITAEEFLEAMAWAEEAGLTNLDERSLMQRDVFRRR